jgi:L-iditol 2-dehydrogenase
MTVPASTIALGKLADGPGNLGLREQVVRMPDAGEALIEVLAAGICGTDLHIADDEFPSNPPVTMGHEVTGIVVETGDGVDPALVGVRVACETYFAYCGVCVYCRNGSPNLCADRRSIGSHVDGGFAGWLTLPARNLHAVPDHVGTYAGAVAEPLACVAHCLFDPPVVSAGDRVLVIGPGTMGLLTAQAARAAGGRVSVVGLERDATRLEIARSLGLNTETVAPGETPHISAPDVVCECSGSTAGATMGMEMVRKGGRYVQVGIFGHAVTLPLDAILYREVTVTSGFASTPRSWHRAMSLLADRLVELDRLVSEVVPLEEWGRAFAATRAAEGVKYLLDPRAERGEAT